MKVIEVKLEMKCENEAFSDAPELEIARILRKLADTVEMNLYTHRLMDINGNRVGEFTVVEED